jgi:hypothetical protein
MRAQVWPYIEVRTALVEGDEALAVWRAWYAKPLPPALQRLLAWLWEGRGITLYVR